MRDLKACLVCLRVDVKLYNMNENQLRKHYNLLTGLQIKKDNGLPEYLCYECNSYLKRFIKFRDKCHRAHFFLQELMQRNKEIKKVTLKAVDHDSIGVKPYLSYLEFGKVHYEHARFKWTKINRSSCIIKDVIPTVSYTTFTDEQMYEGTIKNGNVTLQDNSIKTENFAIDFEETNDEYFDGLGTEETGLDDEQAASNLNEDNTQVKDDNDNNDYVNSDDETSVHSNEPKAKVNDNQRVDGTELEVEYATLHTITKNEAKAVVEITKTFSSGSKHNCHICSRPFFSEKRLKLHLRMHDRHVSGNYWCELCDYYYKSEFLLNTHITEKHMYKYVCKKCPEVNFDRRSAKQHYYFVHIQKNKKVKADDCLGSRPSWLCSKGLKRNTVVDPAIAAKKRKKLPDDYLLYTPVRQEEQYQLVQERKNTRNYVDSWFKCEMCFRGFREQTTFDKHMRKHNPEVSGKFQCDMCKVCSKTARKLYKHMIITHIFRFTCQMCSFVCYNKGQAQIHYNWHKNVTYDCPHCSLQFKKLSTRLTHIRIKHPSSIVCNLCGHSFVSHSGLYCHKQIAHTPAEVEAIAEVPLDTTDPYYCADCNIQFLNQDAFATHLGSSSKHVVTNFSIKVKQRKTKRGTAGRPRKTPTSEHSEILNTGIPTATNCEFCNKFLVNDVQARKHYAARRSTRARTSSSGTCATCADTSPGNTPT